MGICRDTFGKLSYTLTVPVTPWFSKVYSVHRGENKIIKHEPYYQTGACLWYGNDFWQEIEPFDSFIQAVSFLKQHSQQLL